MVQELPVTLQTLPIRFNLRCKIQPKATVDKLQSEGYEKHFLGKVALQLVCDSLSLQLTKVILRGRAAAMTLRVRFLLGTDSDLKVCIAVDMYWILITSVRDSYGYVLICGPSHSYSYFRNT